MYFVTMLLTRLELYVLIMQGLIEKNNLGISNVTMPTTTYVLGYYALYRLLTFRSKLNINLLFCF